MINDRCGASRNLDTRRQKFEGGTLGPDRAQTGTDKGVYLYGYSKYLRRTFSFKKNDVRGLAGFSYQSLARCCSVNH